MSRYDSSMPGLVIFYLIFALVLFFFGIFRGTFANQDVAVRTLEVQGYSNIQIVDHTWFAVGLRGCDNNDASRFTAKATNPTGKPVEVLVCTGAFFKGGTIRTK